MWSDLPKQVPIHAADLLLDALNGVNSCIAYLPCHEATDIPSFQSHARISHDVLRASCG